MSPMIQEQAVVKGTGRGRRWLLVLGLLPVILLTLLVALAMQPIRIGRTVVLTGQHHGPFAPNVSIPWGFSGRIIPASVGFSYGQDVYWIEGSGHYHFLRVGDWLGYVAWFRGRKLAGQRAR